MEEILLRYSLFTPLIQLGLFYELFDDFESLDIINKNKNLSEKIFCT